MKTNPNSIVAMHAGQRRAIEARLKSGVKDCHGGCGQKSLPRTPEFFGKSKNSSDGLHYYCKECERARCRARRTTPKYHCWLRRTRKVRCARANAAHEVDQVRLKTRKARTRKANIYKQRGDLLKSKRLARLLKPDLRECEECGAKKKTMLFFPFGDLVYDPEVNRRLCPSCWGLAMSPHYRSFFSFRKLLCKTDEEKSEWRSIHQQHQDERAEEERVLAAAREKHGEAFADVLEKFLDWPEPERSAKVRAVLAAS